MLREPECIVRKVVLDAVIKELGPMDKPSLWRSNMRARFNLGKGLTAAFQCTTVYEQDGALYYNLLAKEELVHYYKMSPYMRLNFSFYGKGARGDRAKAFVERFCRMLEERSGKAGLLSGTDEIDYEYHYYRGHRSPI